MNKKQNKNKRAFTLTELLIVVIVIGVLSAVTLPKFNRVIENRKVTEAEEMMSAVRTEQERRCAMDKNYTLKFDNLADVISSSDTKNYKYSLQTEGISATSNKGKYTLKMLSYQDGSFCCTGDDCAKLNKNYPNCDGLTFPSSGCGGTDGTVELTPDPTPTPEPTPEPSCEGSQPADQVKACACGTVKASYSCSAATNYKWVLGAFPDCPAKPADETETCSDGKTVRTKSYTCVNGAWTLGNWDKECPKDEDCCSDSMGSAEAQACIKKKYGASSVEARCSNYGNRAACLRALYQGGSQITYRCLLGTGDEDLKNDRNGYSGCKACKENPTVTKFFNSGFLNYACTKTVPHCDIKSPSSSTPPGVSCCTVYSFEEVFSSAYNQTYYDCEAKCRKTAKCSDKIKDGVKLNGSKVTLDCWSGTCYCNTPTYPLTGTFEYGRRHTFKCRNTGETCTEDQMVQL